MRGFVNSGEKKIAQRRSAARRAGRRMAAAAVEGRRNRPGGRFALRAEACGLHKPARKRMPSDPALCTVIGDQQIDHAAVALHPVGLVVRLEIGIVPAVGGFSDRGFVLPPIGVII